MGFNSGFKGLNTLYEIDTINKNYK